jgi:hypothetical protein
MKKLVILFVVLVMVFAFTIPASADGNNPGFGKGPGGGIGPGDGTGPVGGLGPVGGNGQSRGQGQQGPRQNFCINGAIAAIGTSTVTITVTCGNNRAQPYIGTNYEVTVTSLTRYNEEIVDLTSPTGFTDTPILFGDLVIGDLVSLNGTVVNGVWTVRRITVVPALDCDLLP